jgi:hypothetical protein
LLEVGSVHRGSPRQAAKLRRQGALHCVVVSALATRLRSHDVPAHPPGDSACAMHRATSRKAGVMDP